MKYSLHIKKYLFLCIVALGIGTQSIVQGSEAELNFEKDTLRKEESLSLPKIEAGDRIAVKLAYTRQERTDVIGRTWSYELSYKLKGDIHRLLVRAGGDKPTVFEAANVHVAEDGFTITIESLDESGEVPSDITLSLERLTSLRGIAETPAIPGNIEVNAAGEMSWGTVHGVRRYEVQWAFVDADDSIDASLVFRNRPSGIIEVPAPEDGEPRVNINSGYSKGTIYARVRSLGLFPGRNTIRKGPWSNPVEYSVDSNTDLNEARTWWRTTRFDNGGGKRTEVRHYDSLLRQRQIVTTSYPNGNTRISAMLLDDEGRTALTTIDIPVDNNLLSFRTGFLSSGGGAFSSGDLRGELPPALTATGGGQYFRTGNGLIGVPEEGRPYSSIRYSRDARHRTRSETGVGSTLHNNPTRFMYGTAGIEFDQLFGGSAGTTTNYSRIVIQDPNGQGHVKYLDPSGRLLAVGLVGEKPDFLETIPENPFSNGTNTAE
ncbi:MAG: hypothetical protein AB2541_02835, partial [Candidatus Thiodiazotropha sp.]